ncbi:cysteine--tRNA ligase [Thioclava sp.]|uniref:cysteine--tRNA ligase n=1 Tax=Thioclava sp. TaxID=1933450 RepID=UPI003AA863AC
MTQIRLRNSLTRKVEDFHPIDAQNVRMYLCGPTVYDRAHLGNARPVVVFDVLYRLLRHVYGPDHVTYVRNFTDVDDKINATALARQKAGAEGSLEDLIRARTAETIGWYHADMDELGALRPDHEPRATDYIGAMIAMIEKLVAEGHAYAAEGHVLFRVRSYQNYGALSGRTVDDMIAGARVEVAPYKEDPMDFVLWKPSDSDEPGWDSPWGRGRPGWHIECSAMSYELLGASFDIHGGGIDLQFPHHENEIAQSCCAHPEGSFANYWVHNEMLQVEGKKMSKSLGNFFTVRDLLAQGVPGEVIRFVFLQTHYSKPMDWTAEKAKQAEKTLRRIAEFLGADPSAKPWVSRQFARPPQEFVDALASDLNTSVALSLVRKYLKEQDEFKLVGALRLLGFDIDALTRKFFPFEFQAGDNGVVSGYRLSMHGNGAADYADRLTELGNRLYALRETAMTTKDFAPVDAMKAALIAAGVEVRMSKAGVELLPGPDFDPAKLEGL